MFIINVANLNYIMYYYNEIKEMNEITGIFKLHNVLLLLKKKIKKNINLNYLNYIMFYYYLVLVSC